MREARRELRAQVLAARREGDAQRTLPIPVARRGERSLWSSDELGQAIARPSGKGYTRAPEAEAACTCELAPQLPLKDPEGAPLDSSDPRGLGRGVTSVNSADLLANSVAHSREYRKTVDRDLAPWRIGRRAKHRANVRAARLLGRKATWERWHAGRARTLGYTFVSRADDCEKPGGPHVEVACSKCGEVHDLPILCGLRQWCEVCSGKRAAGVRKRLIKGIGRALREARIAWNKAGGKRGLRPEITMLTLGIEHSGDLAADVQTMQEGWARFRATMWHSIGAPAFVRTRECAATRDPGGHAHEHVVALLPKLDLRYVDRVWTASTKGRGRNVDVKGPRSRRAREKRPGRLQPVNVHAAAEYVIKYATKGVHSEDLPAPTMAAWVRAMHNRRLVTTSRRFMDPPEPAPTKCEHEECGGGVLMGPAQYHRSGYVAPPATGPPEPG